MMPSCIHVAAMFRLDSMTSVKDFDLYARYLFGLDRKYDDIAEDGRCAFKRLPYSTNGSLRMETWKDDNECVLCKYTVAIFGTLEDKSDCREIITWFKRTCSVIDDDPDVPVSVRHAFCVAEGYSERYSAVYPASGYERFESIPATEEDDYDYGNI